MKNIAYFLSGCVVAFGFVGLFRLCSEEVVPEPVEIVRVDTVVVHKSDTVRITKTVCTQVTVVDTFKIIVPVPGLPDPFEIKLDKVRKEFEGEKYKAWVSGYEPNLDSIDIFQDVIETTITIHEREKSKRWGLGVQAGMTYDIFNTRPSPYIGIGVSYNLIRW